MGKGYVSWRKKTANLLFYDDRPGKIVKQMISMAIYSMDESKIQDAISTLLDEYIVVAPVHEKGNIIFKEISNDNAKDISLKERPLNTPKHFLYPSSEIIYRYQINQRSVKIDELNLDKHMILFGIRPCDMEAIQFLDKIFTTDYEDTYYTLRRDNTTIVSMDCVLPAKTCFCIDMGVMPFIETGFDLNLSLVDGSVLIDSNTEKGGKIIKKLQPLLRDIDKSLLAKRDKLRSQAHAILKERSIIQNLKQTIEEASEDTWRRIGSGCLQCGACSFVCPECYCFTFIDQPLNDDNGAKIRMASSCMMLSFTSLALGANTRKQQFERIKQYYMHKFVYLPETMGMTGCVGCGRCIEICPAGIEVLRDIQK